MKQAATNQREIQIELDSDFEDSRHSNNYSQDHPDRSVDSHQQQPPNQMYVNLDVAELDQVPLKAGDSLLPKGEDIYQVVQYLDLTMNIEIVLYEFHSIIFWASVLEIAIFGVGLLLFFTFPEQMAFIFMHILHPVRGQVGLIIYRRMPKSHDMISHLKDFGNDKLKFEEFIAKITEKLKEQMIGFATNMESNLKLYFVFTIICILMDFIEFVIQLIRFGRDGDEFSDMVMMATTCLYLIIDFFYFLWVLQQRHKFPPSIEQYVSKTLYGFTSMMKEKFQPIMDKLKNRNKK
ncbi:UNKNOWN [Stylonychia lemnae]|uniref:Uncharacterized protein n=1 Tax=Stylonychia lemnae TaxID=5949 RepID=A0A078AU81_STYLE|nr:UNKNOWN [Stylonychia lemnae]|eukprot:CDW85965.1 UNKNOWN [Stylonychia lemnae]